MKNQLIISLAISLFIYGCDACMLGMGNCYDYIERVYAIENSTDHWIDIEGYSYGVLNFRHSVEGKGILFEGSSDNGWKSGDLSAQAAMGADSIVLIFDSIKTQGYYISDSGYATMPISERHLLVDSLYVIESEELYKFLITEEDYENAAFIED